MVEEKNVILVENWKLWMLFLNMVSPWVSGVHNCQIRICISIELQKLQIALLPIHSSFTVVLSYNSQEMPSICGQVQNVRLSHQCLWLSRKLSQSIIIACIQNYNEILISIIRYLYHKKCRMYTKSLFSFLVLPHKNCSNMKRMEIIFIVAENPQGMKQLY